MKQEEDPGCGSQEERTTGMPTEQLKEALRFSLLTLTGIADKVKELQPQRAIDDPQESEMPNNLLDPKYNRPWWTILGGAAGAYLGYRFLIKKNKPVE